MANTSSFENKKKWNLTQIGNLSKKLLKDQWNLKSSFTINEKDKSVWVDIKGLSVGIFLIDENITMMDVPSSALSRFNHNEETKNYVTQAFKNGLFYIEITNSYCLIHEFLKYKLAEKAGVKIMDSDGAGDLVLTPRPELQNFPSWLNYFEKLRKKSGFITSTFLKIASPSKKEILKTEKEFFPELF